MKGIRLQLSLLGLCLLLACAALAQKAPALPIRFGSVVPADFFGMPTATDTAASVAEYLCDYGTTKIVGGSAQFQAVFERTTRLRIHRKAGYRYATVKVPLYTSNGRYERFSNLKGYTYNLQDGRISQAKLNSEDLYREQLDKNHIQVSFTMPDVREGSILEFTYTITSDFIFNLQDWQFEHSIPVRWSEYRVTLPQFYAYKTIIRGHLPFAVKEELTVPYSTMVSASMGAYATPQQERISALALQLRWAMKDVPAFRAEPFLTTPHDYMRSVHFELAGTNFSGRNYEDLTGKWPTLWKMLEEDNEFGKALSSPAPLAAEAAALRLKYPGQKARAAAVLALVQSAAQYNNHAALFASQPLRRTVERRLGNAADINLLLVQTLRAAGLPATPLLLSTRSHGQMQTLVPAISQFNYVAAHILLPDNTDLLLDATEPELPAGMLPERCLNGQALLADAAGRWLTIRPAARHTELRTARLRLTEHGSLEGSLKLEYAGYAGLAARRQIRQGSSSNYLAGLQRQWPDWEASKPHLLLPDSIQHPVAVELALHMPSSTAQASQLYLALLSSLGTIPYTFRPEVRSYPVNLGMPHEYVSLVTLTLPKGTTVQEMPASLSLMLPEGSGRFQYSVSQPTPETVQMMARMQLNKAEYSPAEYAALRELHQRAAVKCAEMLVLSRK